jgi:hypothetical protein
MIDRKEIEELISEAQSFCYWWDFVPIWRVEWSKDAGGGAWIHNKARARIEMEFTGGRALLAHEVFHSAFEGSPLRKYCQPWGEGFCDAFRYFMVGRECGNSGTNFEYTTRYLMPCRVILDACDRDYDKFHDLWWNWNDEVHCVKETGYLNNKLGFIPGWGYSRVLKDL